MNPGIKTAIWEVAAALILLVALFGVCDYINLKKERIMGDDVNAKLAEKEVKGRLTIMGHMAPLDIKGPPEAVCGKDGSVRAFECHLRDGRLVKFDVQNQWYYEEVND